MQENLLIHNNSSYFPVFIDIETRSEVELSIAGAYKYAENCQIQIITWSIAGGEVRYWDMYSGGPIEELQKLAQNEHAIFIAHNVQFDRTCLRLCPQRESIGLHKIPHTRWWCSMSHAMLHNLPASLDRLGAVLGAKIRKREGKNLVLWFCKPRKSMAKATRGQLVYNTKHSHPIEWENFKQYAITDTETLADIFYRLPRFNISQTEINVFNIYQQINDNGFKIDINLCKKMVETIEKDKEEINNEIFEITNGEIQTSMQRDKILLFLQNNGIKIEKLTANSVEEILNSGLDLPVDLHRILVLRQNGARASTAKLVTALNKVSSDGYIRGAYQIWGAHTHRTAGRGFQPQNLKRLDKQYESREYREYLIDSIMTDRYQPVFDGPVSKTVANLLRSVIIAEKGQYLTAVDLSNIEGRFLAWLAGEDWKIKAFRDFDQGNGPDIYVATYSGTFGVDIDKVTKQERQIGKLKELAFGYGGGVNAFCRFGGSNLDYSYIAELAYKNISQAIYEEAVYAHHKATDIFPIDDPEILIALQMIKIAWRKKHKATVKLWYDVGKGFADTTITGRPSYIRDNLMCAMDVIRDGSSFRPVLRFILPSGASLCYYNPKVTSKKELSYHGVHPLSKQWWEIHTHGAKIIENIVQSGCYDIFAHGLQLASAHGISLPINTHDELVAQGDKNLGELLHKCMVSPPWWAGGFPLAAKAEKPDTRYAH